MRCLECDAEMVSSRETHEYNCGLRVLLLDTDVSRCPRCGAGEVAIPRIEALHRTLAAAVIRKAGRLAPAEIRFLRKYLGLSGVDFAAYMGVEPETVSRWENGHLRMAATADRLLRLLVATRAPVENYPVEVLKAIPDAEAPPVALTMALAAEEWAQVAA